MKSSSNGHSMISAIFYLTLAALLAQATQDHALKIYYYAVACLITMLIDREQSHLSGRTLSY